MKRLLKSALILLFVVFVLPALVSSQPAISPKPAKTVTIGYLVPLTGAIGKWGLANKIVSEIVEEDVNGLNNEKGIKIGGDRYLIKMVFYDTATDAEKAVAGLKRFATLMNIRCVVGPHGTPMSMACLPLLDELKVAISCSAYGPVTAKGSRLVLNCLETSNAHVVALADAAWKLGLKTICILYDKSESFVGWFNEFSRAWEAKGGKILAGEKVDAMGTTDFYPVLTKLSAMNPDGIALFCVSESTGLLIKQTREVGYKGKILASSEVYLTTVKIAGAHAEGILFPGSNEPVMGLESIPPKFRSFVSRFYEKSKGLELAGDELRFYDAFILLALGMEKAGTIVDPYKIRKGAMDVAKERGAKVTYMPIKGFTEGGSGYGIDLNLFTIRNGKIEMIPGYTSELTEEMAKRGRGEK
jgi:ABC-type branched-subunit amino acid transport system substrate-binding protein